MCNFPFIFWWWSGMNQEWKFFRQFSKWVSIPCQLPFLCWSSFSLSYDEICSTYLPQNSSACSSSFENWSNWLKASSVFWVKNKVGLPKMHRAVQKLQIESWYHRISSIAKTPLLILVVGSQKTAWRGNGPNRNPIPKWLSNFHNSFQTLITVCGGDAALHPNQPRLLYMPLCQTKRDSQAGGWQCNLLNRIHKCRVKWEMMQ